MEPNTNHTEIIETLQRQIRAELETAEQLRRQNDLAEKTLEEIQRGRQAELIRARLAFDTNDKVSGLAPMIEQAFRDIAKINQRIDDLESWFERANDILLLLLTERSPQKVAEALEDLEAEMAERETDRRKLIRAHRKNLATLYQQKAAHGMQPPLDLLNRIDFEEQAIRDLTDDEQQGRK